MFIYIGHKRECECLCACVNVCVRVWMCVLYGRELINIDHVLHIFEAEERQPQTVAFLFFLKKRIIHY